MNPHCTKVLGQTVLIRNQVQFQNKLKKFVADGGTKLNVVTDFDFTMSKFSVNNKRAFSCHRVLEECGALGDEYHEGATRLQKKYYPLEVNPDIGHEEKFQHMVDWVTQAHDLLLDSHLSRDILKNAVKKAITENNIDLRNMVTDTCNLMTQHGAPLLIFSAGIADILEEVLLTYLEVTSLDEHIHVISNRCIFGDGPENDGLLVGFEEPVFHVLNKRASAIKDLDTKHPYFSRDDLMGRTNLFLFGDSLGDVLMHEGLHHSAENMLKIGFLNDKPERLLEYLQEKNFDMVILGDPGFEIPYHLIESVLTGNLSENLLCVVSDVV